LGTSADVATTTGIIPTVAGLTKMGKTASTVKTAIGTRSSGLAGGMGALNFAFRDTGKSSNVVVKSFQNMGSNAKSFFTSIGSGFKSFGGILKSAGVAVAASDSNTNNNSSSPTEDLTKQIREEQAKELSYIVDSGSNLGRQFKT
ncbi:MAG: hypothetical protein ACR2F1_00435, partial [Nitrososphaeraceae archaeon]